MEEAWYDKEEDVLDIELKQGVYWKTVELPNGVNIDISRDGSILSIEILSASKAFSGESRLVLEKAKAALKA